MKRMIKGIAAVLVKLVLVLILCIGVTYVTQMQPNQSVPANRYATSDVVYTNGRTAHFDDKNFGELNEGDIVTLHLHLPEQKLFENSTLAFYTFNAVTEVWFEDNLLSTYGADLAENDMMIGNNDFLIAIPDDAWGAEIRIVLRATENHAFSNFTNIKIYPAEAAYRFYTQSDPLGFAIAIVLFIFSLVGLFACAFGGMRGAHLANALYILLTALLVSLWMITNKGIYNVFGFTAYFWQPLEYIAGYAIAIPLLLFYRGMTDRQSKWRRVFSGFTCAAIVFNVAAAVLNFTGIMHYDALMSAAGVLIILCGLLILVYTLQTRADTRKKARVLRRGTYIFVLTCLYEMFIRALYRTFPLPFMHDLPSLIAIGVMAMLLCLIGAYLSDISDKQKSLLTAQIKADTLDKVIGTTPAGICQLVPDDKFTIVSANDIFYKIMGYRDEELQSGKPLDAFTHLYDNERAYLGEKVEEILRGAEDSGEFEFSTLDIDNRPLTIIIRYFYDREDSGNITVNLIDITDRKRMEEELRISEERHKLALNQSGKLFFFLDVPTRTIQLPEKMADAFGMSLKVSHMPDSFIAQGIIDVESVEAYRQLYERIFAGEESGEAVVFCRVHKASEKMLWYKIAFTTVFDDKHNPSSAIITYEDVSEQYQAELSSRWKQLNLISVPEKDYVIAVHDLTQNRLISQTGRMFTRMPEFVSDYDGINAFVLDHFVQDEDREACRVFFDRHRLMEMFRSGQTEDSIEYRSLQNGSVFRWTSIALSLIEDPYNKHVMVQFLFRDIHDAKSGEIQMQHNMDELQKELDNSRIRIMINQMQPHFLYNALSAIQTIVKTDPDYAYQLIYDFTIHLRSSIKALSSDAPIPFADELKNIKAYLNIEMMRFGDSLKVNYEIDCKDFSVIPLSIQPLAENAARHGVYPKGDAGGTVTVRTYETISAYVVEVEDDGVGFDANAILGRESDSVGLKSLIFRLKSLMNADVSIDSRIGAGTKVTVKIPKEVDSL